MNQYLQTQIDKVTQNVVDANANNANANNANANNANTENLEKKLEKEKSEKEEKEKEKEKKLNEQPKIDIIENIQKEDSKTTDLTADTNQHSTTCYIRDATIDNFGYIQNQQINGNTFSKIIDQCLQNIQNNFKNTNLLPIGSILYSVFPLNESDGSFIYGAYKIQSLIQLVPNKMITYIFESQDIVKYNIANVLDRTLQGTDQFNVQNQFYDPKTMLDKTQEPQIINVQDEIQDHQHPEYNHRVIKDSINDGGNIKIKKDYDYYTQDNKTIIKHGGQYTNRDDFNISFNIKDQYAKMFLYIILGYVL